MVIFLNVLSAMASALSISNFFFEKTSIIKKVVCIVFALICGCLSYAHLLESNAEAAKESQRIALENVILKDAESVSGAILVSGGEGAGEYVGYLTLIVGFYDRHRNIYGSEYNLNKKQLESWRAYLDSRRDKNETIYGSELDQLRGLVKSGDAFIESIAKSKVRD